MKPSLLPRSRVCAVAAATLLVLGACDDPAEMAKEVVDAQGDCSQDSLRASSETCVQMFERYAGMATDAIHTYIGGMKAMDQALKRLPPPNFDTAGLGHAFSAGAVPPDSLERARMMPESARRRLYGSEQAAPYGPVVPMDQASRWDEPYGPYDPDGYEPGGYPAADYPGERYDSDPRGYSRDGRESPGYAEPRRADPRLREPQPERRPGVLLPPSSRLGRPWLRERDPRQDPRVDPRVDPRMDPRADPRWDPDLELEEEREAEREQRSRR